jgi:hypothetical protein
LPVAVERRERDPRGLEVPKVLVAGVTARAHIRDRQVRRGQEAARVDLRGVESEVAQDIERLPERQMVQAGGVGTELEHGDGPWPRG